MRALLLLLAFAPACTSHRWFAPREHQNGYGPDGWPAAVYALQADGAEGEVRVWSAGSAVRDGAGGDGTEIHLGFELENTGGQPLQLDLSSLRLDGLRADGQEPGPLPATRYVGSPEAAPGTTARVDVWFEPGPGIAPRQVDAFAARFVVRSADAAVCNQLTPFVPYADDSYRYWHYYRDPWVWGWYGYGWGWYGYGWGWYGHPWHHCH